MGYYRAINTKTAKEIRRTRTTLEKDKSGLQRYLMILRTGAPWHDMPDRYPPYQTCHRRFQKWVKDGTLAKVLRALAEDLRQRGNLDLTECFIDGTFILAKKGVLTLERPSGAKVRSSWQWQTALVFLSRCTPLSKHFLS